jgi:hypothetical protein
MTTVIRRFRMLGLPLGVFLLLVASQERGMPNPT